MADTYTYDDKLQFIKNLYCPARQCADETGCSWELILAQAAQETGWGEKVLPGSNNIFNIKADSSWTGESKVFHVWEMKNGQKVWEDDPFRMYPSILDALRDRQKFLAENPRYKAAGLYHDGVKGNLAGEANALQKAGYASDGDYAKALTTVFNGPTMQRAIAMAKKDGCKGCLPTINLYILDAAKVPLAKTKIKVSQGSKSAELVTGADGHAQIQAALSGGQVSIEVYSEHDKKWIPIDPKVTPTSPPTAVTLVAPTLVVPTATEHHDPVTAAAASAADAAGSAAAASAVASPAPSHSASSAHGGATDSYTVKKGDSLSRIAKAHSTSYLTLARLNAINSPYFLRPGQILKVPKAQHAAATSSPAPAPAPAPAAARPAPTAALAAASHPSAPPAAAASSPQQGAGSQTLRPDNAVHAVHYRSAADHPQTDVLSARRAPWMAIAEQEFEAGVKRRGGAQPDQHIEEYFSATSLGRQRSDNLAYCAAFVNWCLTRAGYHGNNNAGANSLSTWGRATRGNKPAYGAIAVVHFPTGGFHVTFVNGKAPSRPNAPRVATLGGNQGHAHEVSHSAVPAGWVTHYRFPTEYVENDEDYDLHLVSVDSAQMSAASTH
ncbi:glucosaminidase domain-containing protein [Paraburkholderia sp. BCC1885]|uniref:glucosaminidase domain-containing protein n=1 Tax=Paraburkholderia sp. BCC1885 TaxID=2562669 RepID=UPI0011821E50|nr:glucosaminidase domain-containing protein [Paraburkholderia sp. BCC1885]